MEYLIQKQTLDDIGNAVRSVSEDPNLIPVSNLAAEIRGLSSLNFRVLGGTDQPENPRENDIWVQTDTAISGWEISAVEPSGAEGAVWISIGMESQVAFNAVKKNVLAVYPVWAKMYSGGSWEDVDAHLYRNGAWMRFSEVITAVYIIQNGYVDFNTYPYTYKYTAWDSMTNSDKTYTGGVDDRYIKVNHIYEEKSALYTNSSNGKPFINTFDNVTVPNNASVFKFEYYLLGSEGKNPSVSVGDATVSIDRAGANKVKNGIAQIDVTGLRGQTVKFSYTTHGGANNYSNYVGNAWFE